MWKLKKHNGKIVSAVFYKDKGGRKAVAIATDGSEHGKRGAAEIIMKNVHIEQSSTGWHVIFYEWEDEMLVYSKEEVFASEQEAKLASNYFLTDYQDYLDFLE
jgi:hypothetical protein